MNESSNPRRSGPTPCGHGGCYCEPQVAGESPEGPCSQCNSPGLTRLVVLRGNSASGKSSVAAGIRDKFGRGLALVGQDNLRRIVLRERDRPGAANIGLIGLTARYALDAGFHVVVEGILYADRYGDMLAQLRADHRGPSHAYYLDVAFAETLVRHATKPIADDVSEAQLREWYRPRDLLPGGVETVIGADSALHETVDRIMLDTGLAHLPPVDR